MRRLTYRERVDRAFREILGVLEEMEAGQRNGFDETLRIEAEKPLDVKGLIEEFKPKRGRGRPPIPRYRGYRNFETYTVAYWILEDPLWGQVARESRSWNDFCKRMWDRKIFKTPDDVHLVDAKVRGAEIARLIKSL